MRTATSGNLLCWASQFVISGLLFSLLYIVNGQYQLMLGLDLGYDYDNVAIVSIDASDANQRQQCMA